MDFVDSSLYPSNTGATTTITTVDDATADEEEDDAVAGGSYSLRCWCGTS